MIKYKMTITPDDPVKWMLGDDSCRITIIATEDCNVPQGCAYWYGSLDDFDDSDYDELRLSAYDDLYSEMDRLKERGWYE